MLSKILDEKKYTTLLIQIYEGDETDEWRFHGDFNVGAIMYDGDTIECYADAGYSNVTVRIPVAPDSEVKWFDESDCYEYRMEGKRFELFFFD